MRKYLPLPLLALLLALVAAPEAHATSVARTLDELESRGALTPALAQRYRRDWSHARSAVRHLHGAARANLGGVLSNTWSLARDRLLAASVLPSSSPSSGTTSGSGVTGVPPWRTARAAHSAARR